MAEGVEDSEVRPLSKSNQHEARCCFSRGARPITARRVVQRPLVVVDHSPDAPIHSSQDSYCYLHKVTHHCRLPRVVLGAETNKELLSAKDAFFNASRDRALRAFRLACNVSIALFLSITHQLHHEHHVGRCSMLHVTR